MRRLILVLFMFSLGCGGVDADDLEYHIVEQGLMCEGDCPRRDYAIPMPMQSRAIVQNGHLDRFESSPGARLVVDHIPGGPEHGAVCVDGSETYHERIVELLEVDDWTFRIGECGGEPLDGTLIMWTLYKGI